MGDDLTTGGILPIDDTTSDDAEFDPDAIESDDLLDDIVGEDLLTDTISLEEEDAPIFPDEVE